MAATTLSAACLTQIQAHIPIKLDMAKMNYDSWRILLETHCLSFSLTGHIDGSSLPTGPTDTNWHQLDNTVKMWIYGTISESLLNSVLKTQSSARELWLTLENLFRDNKEARAIQLENELRNLVIGDMSVHEYCQKLKSISDMLTNVDSPVSDRALVMHLLNGLSSKFDNIINVIKHRFPPCTFSNARSMLVDEESRLKTKRNTAANNDDNSSSPQILLTTTPNHQSQAPDYSNPHSYSNNQRGGHRNRGNRGRHGRGRNNYNQNWNHNSYQPPWQWQQQQQQPFWQQHQWRLNSQPQTFVPPYASAQPGILGSMPQPQRGAFYLAQTSQTLASAFNTMTLQDPNDSGWYMDTGATAHLTSQPGMIFISPMSPSYNNSLPLITVGNGSNLPATAIGNSSISTTSRSLILRNVLLCPRILKNLVSVRQFTKDNSCSVEFDPFGFLIKDLQTRAPIIRCNSIGPLYSITPSSHHALIWTSPSSSDWHRRLGHPGNSTLRLLISSGLLKCSQPAMSPLCHPCQLGKHTRQPFFSSTSKVFSVLILYTPIFGHLRSRVSVE